ncbi:tetratricopeptide repeat protein [Geminocystis sp. CENA526]|uniref:tetratricopeptide repeat protein n=1 Tax=Geminocystis sp. CENA526 TaxID=1355871 RepID=UPI003D6E5EF2
MECLTILTPQQEDFCQRVKAGHLLYCDLNGLFSELVIISEKTLKEIRNNCTNITVKYQSAYQDIDLFNNCFKNALINFCVQQIYGDLLLPINNDIDIGDEDGKIFLLKDNPKIKVFSKVNYSSLDSIEWHFCLEEINNNQIILCLQSLQDFSNIYDEYRLILAGFLPCKLIDTKQKHLSLTPNKLLYCGGLRGYLNSLIQTESYYLSIAKEANHHGDYLSAIANYTKALEINFNDSKTHLLRAISRWKIGDKQGALADCDEAIRIDLNNDLAYHWRGYINFKLGNYESSIEDYTQEIRLNPLSTYAYYQRGFTHEKLNNLVNAFDDYSQTIRINKNLYQGFYNRGNIRYELGDKEGAIEDLTQALKLNPCLAQGYYNRGIIYSDFGEVELAIKDYELAIKLMPDYAKAYYNLAILLADLGDYEKAVNYYEQIIKIDPDFYQADYNKESLLKYINQQKPLNIKEQRKVKIRRKKISRHDNIKLEQSSDLLLENIPNQDELMRLDRAKIKEVKNSPQNMTKSKESIEKKLFDPWNTKQY